MTLYLAYYSIFALAAVVAGSGFSEFLFFSPGALLAFGLLAVLPGAVLLVLARRLVPEDGLERRCIEPSTLRVVFIGWAVLAFIDIASQGYVPIVALFRGEFIYTDFKPPLHGLTNALSLCFVCAAPFVQFRRKGWAIAAVILFQLAILHRGPAFYHLLGCVIAYAAANPAKLRKQYPRYVAGAVVAMLLFGAIGALRQGVDFFVYEAFGIAEEYRWVPSGIVWVLVYLASPTSNLLYNLSLSEPTCQPNMWSTLSTLVPGPLRNAVLGHEPTEAAYLPCEITGDVYYPGLNVSTGFVQFLIDFGPLGLIIPSLIVGGAIWALSRRRFDCWGPLEAVLCVLLFVNLFAPAFNQLSFVITLAGVLVLRTRSGEEPTATEGEA